MDLINVNVSIVVVILFISLQCECNGQTILPCDGEAMNVTCASGNRIRLMCQMYSHDVNSNHCQAANGSSEVDGDFFNDCRTDAACQEPFPQKDAYLLYTACSGEQTCTIASTSFKHQCNSSGESNPSSDVVANGCVNGNNFVQMCKENSKTSQAVQLIYEGQRKDNGDEEAAMVTNKQKTCRCNITGNQGYNVIIEDFRPLRPNQTNLCSSSAIRGYNFICNSSNNAAWENFIYKQRWNPPNDSITLENLFAGGLDDKPTMVWIRVSGTGGGDVTVKCEAPIDTENVGTTFEPQNQSESDQVPVAAIVVPIVLIIVGLSLGLVVWISIKHRRAITKPDSTTEIAAYAQGDFHFSVSENETLKDNETDFDDAHPDYAIVDRSKKSEAVSEYNNIPEAREENKSSQPQNTAGPLGNTENSDTNRKDEPQTGPEYANRLEIAHSAVDGPGTLFDESSQLYSNVQDSCNSSEQMSEVSFMGNVYSNLEVEITQDPSPSPALKPQL